jgi:hypothetical protein
MKNHILFAAFVIISLLYFFSSCADKLPDPNAIVSLDCTINPTSYVGHVKGILDAECNTSNCHSNGSLIPFGDYSTLSDARKQDIYTRVYVTKNMPPAGMAAELVDSIRCWSENGYLENTPTTNVCTTTRITYVAHIKNILDAECNTSGCHDDNFQSSFGAYSTLGQARIEDIYSRVCVIKNMPPAGMAAERVDSIRCWSENGYLEN